MTAEKGKRAAYTLEYRLEAVRLVQGGQACTVTAKVLDIPKQTLGKRGLNRVTVRSSRDYCKLSYQLGQN